MEEIIANLLVKLFELSPALVIIMYQNWRQGKQVEQFMLQAQEREKRLLDKLLNGSQQEPE